MCSPALAVVVPVNVRAEPLAGTKRTGAASSEESSPIVENVDCDSDVSILESSMYVSKEKDQSSQAHLGCDKRALNDREID